MNHIPLELYLYCVIEKNWARIGIAVHQENLKDVDMYVKVTPGDMKRGQVAKALKKKFLASVENKDTNKIKALDLGDFSKLLPGDCTLGEIKVIDRK